MRRLPLVLVAASFGVTATTRALPPVVVEQRVALTVETLLVDPSDTRGIGEPVTLEIGPDAEEKAAFSVPWGRPGGTVSVVLTASLRPASGDGPPAVRCQATVDVPGGRPRVSDRVVEGEGTALFEILDGGGRRIVLALKTEPVERAVVHRFAKVGAPVRFLVAVERVDGDKAVALETNRLNTFVGQSVGYSFRLGQEDVRLDLLPISLSGDILTIQASISGSLPGSGVTSLVSRQERIVASRMTTSAIAVTAGTPPSGYRFQVTPDF